MNRLSLIVSFSFLVNQLTEYEKNTSFVAPNGNVRDSVDWVCHNGVIEFIM